MNIAFRGRRLLLSGLLVFMVAGTIGVVTWLRSGSSDHEIWKQGLAALGKNDFDSVLACIQRLNQKPTDSGYAQLLEAAVSIRTNAPELGLRRLQKLDVDGPRREEILLLSGEALYQLKMLSEARQTLLQLVSENPDCVDAHRWLSSIWYDLGANDQAIHHLLEVARLDPSDYRPHWLMGVIFRDFENFPEAISHLETAWKLTPPQGARNDIGVFLSRSLQAEHHYEKALRYLESCDPVPDVLVEKAKAQLSLTRIDDAENTLRQCAPPEDEQSGSEYFLTYGDILETRSDIAGARQKYEEGVARFPHDEDLQYRLAIALKTLGETERSAVEMAKWEKKNAQKNRLVELNRLAAEQPLNAQVRYELSDLCNEMQRPGLAEMWKAAAIACERAAGTSKPDSQPVPNN
jgi:tetratricopeptide (TPR) repeat protein